MNRRGWDPFALVILWLIWALALGGSQVPLSRPQHRAQLREAIALGLASKKE